MKTTLAMLLCVVAISGCKKDETSSGPPPPPPAKNSYSVHYFWSISGATAQEVRYGKPAHTGQLDTTNRNGSVTLTLYSGDHAALFVSATAPQQRELKVNGSLSINDTLRGIDSCSNFDYYGDAACGFVVLDSTLSP